MLCLLGFGAYFPPTSVQVDTEGVEVPSPQSLEIILGKINCCHQPKIRQKSKDLLQEFRNK